MTETVDPAHTIAYQGEPGAYSDLACPAAYPDMTTLPCASFEQAFAAVQQGRAGMALIPTENSVAGRVPDNHQLLTETGQHSIDEHFPRVQHPPLPPPLPTQAT